MDTQHIKIIPGVKSYKRTDTNTDHILVRTKCKLDKCTPGEKKVEEII